jgi:hypothetical protein
MPVTRVVESTYIYGALRSNVGQVWQRSVIAMQRGNTCISLQLRVSRCNIVQYAATQQSKARCNIVHRCSTASTHRCNTAYHGATRRGRVATLAAAVSAGVSGTRRGRQRRSPYSLLAKTRRNVLRGEQHVAAVKQYNMLQRSGTRNAALYVATQPAMARCPLLRRAATC